MTPDHELHELLTQAARTTRAAVDPAEDLARAQAGARARTRRRRRAGAGALGVMVTLGGLGVLAHQLSAPPGPGPGSSSARQQASVTAPPRTSAIRFVAARFETAPYTFDLTPVGWSVQGQNAFAVTIAPDDGSTSSNPDDFVGKLVILFDENPPQGRQVVHDGRRIWIGGDSGSIHMATRTRDDEPPGVVRIQYPARSGWDEDDMLSFLASVHVGAAAQPGHG